MMSAALSMDEVHRYAVDWECVTFAVNYRKGPEVVAPRNSLDYLEAIEHIVANADKYGINKNQICAGGCSGGAWICLGAMIQY